MEDKSRISSLKEFLGILYAREDETEYAKLQYNCDYTGHTVIYNRMGSVNYCWQAAKHITNHHNNLAFSEDLSSQWVNDPAHITQKDEK